MIRREVVINTLLGTLLVLIFAFLVAATFGLIASAAYAIRLAVGHFLPGMVRPWDAVFYGFVSLAILIGCAKQIGNRLWTNAFLSFIAALTIALPWLLNSNPRTGLGDSLRFQVTWFVFLLLPQMTRISRGEFVACASVLAAAFALNVGLLGSGTLSTVAEISLSVAVIRWILIRARDGRYGEPWKMFSASRT
jgi:hypothetical protein